MRPGLPVVPLLVIGIVAGCGTSSGPRVPANQPPDLPPAVIGDGSTIEVRVSNPERGVAHELPFSANEVWQALTDVYSDYDIEPDVVDPRGRQLGVERLTRSTIAGERSDNLARCGNEGAGPSAASRFRIRFEIVSRVVPEGTGAVLHTRVQASASPVDGSSIGTVACVSTGRLEQRIMQGVALKLGIRT